MQSIDFTKKMSCPTLRVSTNTRLYKYFSCRTNAKAHNNICHMFISRCLVRYEHFCVIKTTKNELIFRSINRYLSFPALTVRFITRRFIGDYDPDLGRSNSDAVTLAFMIKSQGHLTVKKNYFRDLQ